MRLDSPQRRGALLQIAQKNPTRTSLKARFKSYLFHLYWNEAGPFNKTDVAVISSDRTTRGNDASLLCYLSSERVPGLCELSWFCYSTESRYRTVFQTRSPDGWERVDYISLSKWSCVSTVLPPVCCWKSSYWSKTRRLSWFPHIQYFSSNELLCFMRFCFMWEGSYLKEYINLKIAL